MKKQYRSRLMASVHETAEGLHEADVMDMRTMRQFDDLCLTPVKPLQPEEIRALRQRERASQTVKPTETNELMVVEILDQLSARGTAFKEIENPVAWQKDIRQDRPLPGRT
jgi:hypothetical protein